MFRMTLYGHRLSNGGLTDSHLPLDVPGGSLDLGYLPRAPPGRYPTTRVKDQRGSQSRASRPGNTHLVLALS